MAGTEWDAWIGGERVIAETLSTVPAERMAATLDSLGADHPLGPGDGLPALWHWLYFVPAVPLSKTGRDGHPERGDFLPPVPLPRRMFAGARYDFRAPLRLGAEAVQTSRIRDVTEKTGRSGHLVFVSVVNEFSQDGKVCVVEEQDIVYREDPGRQAGAKPAPAPSADVPLALWEDRATPGEVMLFRYSAVTFNSHRIHYDLAYATGVEGYDGLVVHGPLTASLLAEAAQKRADAPLTGFSFRGVSPLTHGTEIALRGIGTGEPGRIALEARVAETGRLVMSAEARFG